MRFIVAKEKFTSDELQGVPTSFWVFSSCRWFIPITTKSIQGLTFVDEGRNTFALSMITKHHRSSILLRSVFLYTTIFNCLHTVVAKGPHHPGGEFSRKSGRQQLDEHLQHQREYGIGYVPCHVDQQ